MINLRKLNEANVDIQDIASVKNYIQFFALATQRNYLSSIIVATDAMGEKELTDEYRKELHIIVDKYAEDYENGQKSEAQNKNWTTMKALYKVMNAYKRD